MCHFFTRISIVSHLTNMVEAWKLYTILEAQTLTI